MHDRRHVHLVDDEEAVRNSVGFLLRAAGYHVQSWDSSAAFVENVRHAERGCVLLDVQMPDMGGLEVQAAMADQGVSMPVIVLTGHGNIAIAVKAMKAGAAEFIEKPFDRELLLKAVANAFDQLRNTEKHRQSAAQARAKIAALTSRERDVLEGLVNGMPNKTIAYDLGISPRTVEVYRANMMLKLNVTNLPDALRIAFAAGLGNEL